MTNTAFINIAKLDFDNSLDFSALEKLTTLQRHNARTDEEILELVRDQDIIVTKELPLGKELIDRFPSRVRLICEAGTGYNNIDIAAARGRNIAVCNVPGYSTGAVAQLAITLILNLSISLVRQQRMLHEKRLDNFTSSVRVPLCEVHDKTLGVIGFGAIARQVARIARSLEMDVLVHTRTPRPAQHPEVRFVGLEELLGQSDFVSLHCPLTADTHHLIDKGRLALMKPAAFLVNTSRGALIKEADLIEALEKGAIAGAGLDVQDPEPPEPDNPLFAMDNVILTPHIGWKSFETRQRLVTKVAENIESFIKGDFKNRVA
jgi:glycerate dehydrogenase